MYWVPRRQSGDQIALQAVFPFMTILPNSRLMSTMSATKRIAITCAIVKFMVSAVILLRTGINENVRLVGGSTEM